jgi:hypothetical protein
VLGTERFQKELLAQRAVAQRSAFQPRLVQLLGPACELYLQLVRNYGPDTVATALQKTHAAGAFGAAL